MRSHSSSFVLKKRDGCAVCINIAPCPACPKGQQCQQIFRTSCQDCPVNKCAPIPGYTADSGPNKSALGGGLAALVIVALGAFAWWFWRRLRAKRRRIALHENALERREKLKNEKEATTLQLGGGRAGSDDAGSQFAIADDDDLTEYTQVTGSLGSQDSDSLGALAAPGAFRRRSFGAATHLSRITEGAEEEEDEPMPPLPTGAGAAAAGVGKRATAHSVRSSARSFVSAAGPRISIGSGTSFGSHNIIPIAFKPTTPTTAQDADEAASEGYETVSSLPLPSAAHRAPGARVIEVNTARQAPVRPTRAPDLNLRLPDTQRGASPSSPLASAPAGVEEQPAYGFMSIDPVQAYARSERPLSAATVNTIGSTHSGSLSYVLSAPQVITPVSAEGARRVQLGNGGKAQLVRVPSGKRTKADGGEDPFQDPAHGGELAPPRAGRFERTSTVSTSTLGIPFGDDPFGPAVQPDQHASPLDADERTSWLGDDPFTDPTAGAEAQPRTSIGGLSLLGQFEFDFARNQADTAPLPSDALKRVEQHK